MKSYLILIHLFFSLPAVASDENTPFFCKSSSLSPDNAESISGRAPASSPIDIKESSARTSDYFNRPDTVPVAQVPRRALFEPHMRRIEEDFIRQLTFKIRIRKHVTEDRCIKICIEGFLRDKRMMKQTVDIEY